MAAYRRARELQAQHADKAYIPQPFLFWNNFYADDQNTKTLMRAFEAIAASGAPDEQIVRRELLMLAVTLKHSSFFRTRLMAIELDRANAALREERQRPSTWARWLGHLVPR